MNDLLQLCFEVSQAYLSSKTTEFVRYFAEKNAPIYSHRLVIVTGPRGVGKTTALLQIVRQNLGSDPLNPLAIYIPIDHFKLKNVSIYSIGEAFSRVGGELVCIDEIHKYPNWAQELKSLFETFPKLRILASGSSGIQLEKAAYDVSRRAIIDRVHGMSFREFLGLAYGIHFKPVTLGIILTTHPELAADIVRQVNASGHSILSCFRRYLEVGYYPYFLEFSDRAMFYRTLEQQVKVTLDSDIPTLVPTITGASIKKITNLLAFIARSVPYTPNYRQLKTLMDVSDERTLKHYLKLLEDSGLIVELPRYIKGLKRLEEIGKIVLNDPNLLWALSPRVESGTVRETFVVSMLRCLYDVALPERGDFLIEMAGKPIVFEVGGKQKGRRQIGSVEDSYRLLDDIEVGVADKIPLWLVGFLY